MQRWVAPEWALQRRPEGEAPAAASASELGASSATLSASTSAVGDDETRMEDLAGKLYDKIRARLRNELLVDRERAGFLTDLR